MLYESRAYGKNSGLYSVGMLASGKAMGRLVGDIFSSDRAVPDQILAFVGKTILFWETWKLNP